MKPMIRAGFALLLLAMTSACSSLLYYPTGYKYAEPAQLGMKYEELYFSSGDGTKLMAWYFHTPARKIPKATLIYFHGNGANLSNHFAMLSWVLDHGYDFFIFDYRGYGGSEGQPDPEGTVKDGMAAIRWVRAKAPEQKLVVFAQSLGGAVALRSLAELNHEIPIEWIVIDSSFKSYRQAGAGVLSRNWFTYIFQPLTWIALSDEWAPSRHLGKIAPTPVLVMHGTMDTTIDFELGQELYEALPGPKEFVTIEGGEHIDSMWAHDGKYRKLLLERLEARFGQKKP